MGYALSARGIFAPAQKCRMYQSRSTFPQGAALGYGQHLGLQPAPIIYRAFVQIGSFSTDVFLIFSAALGIARTSSALHSLARKLAAARHSPSELGLCSRLAQTFLFSLLTNINYRGEGRIKDILYICLIIFDFAMLLADWIGLCIKIKNRKTGKKPVANGLPKDTLK